MKISWRRVPPKAGFLLAVFCLFTNTNPLHSQWIQTNGPYGGDVYCFAVSGTNLFAGTGDGVFLSTDNGTSWTRASTGLTGTYVSSFAVSGTNLFAGTYGFSGGVFLSTDNGTSWTQASTGLTSTLVSALAVSGTNLFAGTDGGVWRRPLSEMITSVEGLPTDLPTHFSLKQNYPNPFNPSTTISYDLPRKSQVRLAVFNALGQQVASLVDGEQQAGYYDVRFFGSGLASGAYFYRLQAGNFVETKRLLLLK